MSTRFNVNVNALPGCRRSSCVADPNGEKRRAIAMATAMAVALLAGHAQAASAASAGTNEVVVLRGQTIGEIVERFTPHSREHYARAMREVMALNQSRFPRGRADLVGEGFRLALPAWIHVAPIANSTETMRPVSLGTSETTARTTASSTSKSATVRAPERTTVGAAKVSIQPSPLADRPELPTSSSAEVVVAQVTSLDRLEAEQARLRQQMAGKPKAYEDRVLDRSALPPLPEESPTMQGSGYRAWLGETRVSHSTGNGNQATEIGARTEYRHETLNHGEWIAQLDVRNRSGDNALSIGPTSGGNEARSFRATLRNVGYPITPQTFADTTLGDHYAQVTDGLARGYRASFASGSTVRGISTYLFARDFDLRAGIGARGTLVGGPFPGFERSEGFSAWLGGTQRFANGYFAAAQLTHASGIRSTGSSGNESTGNITAVAAATGFGAEEADSSGLRGRLVAASSYTDKSISPQENRSFGIFAEGGFRTGASRHEFGAFFAQPHLRFGDGAFTSDNRGAYWRLDQRGTRLNWGAGLDFEETNPDKSADAISQRRIGVSANAQYRWSRATQFGGNINLSDSRYRNADVMKLDGDGNRSANASIFMQTRLDDWGRSRISLTARHNETIVANGVAATGQEFQWEHDWITGKYETMRPEFITTVGYARDASNGQVQTYPTAQVQWKYFVDPDFWFGGNLRYTSRTTNLATSRGLSGSVNAEKIFTGAAAGWRMGLQASINEARVTLGGLQPIITRSNDKTVMLYVRYEGSTGTPFQSFGQRTLGSAGAGSIRGIVYFDGNRDGEQQSDERGVPGVEVVLDSRYRITTDRDGRFEFPIVPTGTHRITLQIDTVPLPWGIALERGLQIDVPLRGSASAAIPVVKVGE